MTQIIFTVGEQITAARLNQATEGYKFLRRTTYAGSAGSTVGNAIAFTTTWFVGSGTSALYVRVVGGGGGTPSARGGTPANTSGVSAGGGGGGYAERWILSGFGSSQVILVGLGGQKGISGSAAFPGGQSKFGNLLSASGGMPGDFFWHSVGPGFVGGGAGGVGSQGINAAGTNGGIGFILPTNLVLSGRGGQSAFGGPGGAERGSGGGGIAGLPGGIFGGGGGGACIANAGSLINFDGATGAAGCVVVDEYA